MKLKTIGANQTELAFPSGIVLFFSYETPVAAFIPGKGVLKSSTKHSKTTSKHVNSWVTSYGRNPATTEERDQAYFNFLASNPETVTN